MSKRKDKRSVVDELLPEFIEVLRMYQLEVIKNFLDLYEERRWRLYRQRSPKRRKEMTEYEKVAMKLTDKWFEPRLQEPPWPTYALEQSIIADIAAALRQEFVEGWNAGLNKAIGAFLTGIDDPVLWKNMEDLAREKIGEPMKVEGE